MDISFSVCVKFLHLLFLRAVTFLSLESRLLSFFCLQLLSIIFLLSDDPSAAPFSNAVLSIKLLSHPIHHFHFLKLWYICLTSYSPHESDSIDNFVNILCSFRFIPANSCSFRFICVHLDSFADIFYGIILSLLINARILTVFLQSFYDHGKFMIFPR